MSMIPMSAHIRGDKLVRVRLAGTDGTLRYVRNAIVKKSAILHLTVPMQAQHIGHHVIVDGDLELGVERYHNRRSRKLLIGKEELAL